jgi:radical SAM protein with 4Fe4S-binding SPASM domain
MFLITSSYFLSRILKRPFHWGLPISISVEPTTACNLKCPECPSGLRSFTRDQGNLKSSFFSSLMDEIGQHLSYLIFYFQGEPFLNKSLLAMIQEASQKGIYTATSTNGHFFTEDIALKTVESGLDRCIISIDGTTQEVYEQYRKEGNLDQVLEGTKNLIAARKKLNSKTPYIIFQFLVVQPNEHQIDEVFQLASALGVDEVALKTAQIYDYQNGSPLIPTKDRYSRYRKNSDGTYSIKGALFNHCWRLWHSAVITWDGWVVPCCFDKDASHKMGQVKQQTFREVWRGSNYHQFRKSVLKSRSEIDICTNCTEGNQVWTS